MGRRPDGSPSLMCYVPPSNSPLSVVPSFVLPSREPPPDSPQVYFVPPSLLTRSTVLLPQNPCVLHSRILFYLLSHSPSSAASIEGIEHRPPASFKFTFSSSHHSVWNSNPIYCRSPVNTKCQLCLIPLTRVESAYLFKSVKWGMPQRFLGVAVRVDNNVHQMLI